MTVLSKREALLLFVGDILFFFLSLWLMLVVRYFELPSWWLFYAHLQPFSMLFLVWVIVFFIAGLYEKHTVILKNKLPNTILNAQIVNSVIAVLFFYFIPYFGITPKTSLFIYLLISFVLILVWRIYGHSIWGFQKKKKAILIGSGDEMKELREEVNNNSKYGLFFVSSIDLDKIQNLDFQEEVLKVIYAENIHVVAIDLRNGKVEPLLPNLYNLIFSKVRFIDMYKIYEDIFDRVPLSLVKYNWFLENISAVPKGAYDFVKRLMDISIASITGVISLIVYPFIALLIKIEDGGPVFLTQERLGKNNQAIKLHKFRSMSVASSGNGVERDPQVTRIGKFIRKTRIDELPQLWDVLRGDISLIGPRPEFANLVKTYEKEIPYYNVRHLIKPGLSGWAQLYQNVPPKFGVGVNETKIKLSYDLYYLKNRSFMLDIKIALKTLKTLLSRSGL